MKIYLGHYCSISQLFAKFLVYYEEMMYLCSKKIFKLSVMVRKYNSQEEMIAAFKYALGARDAFEDLVKGKIDKSEFENRGYTLMQLT